MVNQEMQMASMRAKCGLSTGLSSRSFRDDKGCKVRASDKLNIRHFVDIVAALEQNRQEIITQTRIQGPISLYCLKVPECENFDLLYSRYFCTTTPL